MPLSDIPLRPATAAQLASLRRLLKDAGYTPQAICERLELSDVYEVQQYVGAGVRKELKDALDVILRIFLIGESVTDVDGAKLPPGLTEICRELGLMEAAAFEPKVLFYPVGDLYIVSDLAAKPEDTADLVFPAVTPHTVSFLRMLSRTPCDAFLELCGGTGAAALSAAHYGARHAWTADISERAQVFAEFNARLNEIHNVDSVLGDLYEPVAGLTFDRICAHPPYMPAREQKFMYRDGGNDGEWITRRVIEGIPSALRPGGRFHMAGLMVERDGKRIEQRLREMLGPSQAEFDILVIVASSYSAEDFYVQEARSRHITWTDVGPLCEALEATGLERLVYAWTLIQRHGESREPFTARRAPSDSGHWRELDWVMRNESKYAAPDALAKILDLRPLPAPNVEMTIRYALKTPDWNPVECVFKSGQPLPIEAKGPSWMAMMVDGCNGVRTVREILDMLRANHGVGVSAPPEDFAKLVRPFLAGGLLYLTDDPPPHLAVSRPGA